MSLKDTFYAAWGVDPFPPGHVNRAMEKAIQPFIHQAPKPFQRRPDPKQDLGEAVLQWGARMNAEVTTIQAVGFTVNWPDDKTSDTSRERSRQVTTERVTNPEDENQYVDVERVQSIIFVDENGKIQRLIFRDGIAQQV